MNIVPGFFNQRFHYPRSLEHSPGAAVCPVSALHHKVAVCPVSALRHRVAELEYFHKEVVYQNNAGLNTDQSLNNEQNENVAGLDRQHKAVSFS